MVDLTCSCYVTFIDFWDKFIDKNACSVSEGKLSGHLQKVFHLNIIFNLKKNFSKKGKKKEFCLLMNFKMCSLRYLVCHLYSYKNISLDVFLIFKFVCWDIFSYTLAVHWIKFLIFFKMVFKNEKSRRISFFSNNFSLDLVV